MHMLSCSLPAQVKLLEQNEDRFGAKASPDTHFGHDVIPHALRDKLKVVAHHFTGYWRVSLILAGTTKWSLPCGLPHMVCLPNAARHSFAAAPC